MRHATLALQARSKLPKKRRRVLPVEQPRRKRDVGVANRRVNAMKHQHTTPPTAGAGGGGCGPTHPAIFKDAFGGAKIGHVNGVNVIGLTLQGPSVPGLAVLKPPAVLQPGDFINVPQLSSLQPRQPTTGNVDLLLPLQPKLLVPLVERRESKPEEMVVPEPKVTLHSHGSCSASGSNTPGGDES
uniref:Uncharacterized protein n=1 Tax=Anopheles albimanus TaxID=7167 RepID=A0A182F5V2_ANOAL